MNRTDQFFVFSLSVRILVMFGLRLIRLSLVLPCVYDSFFTNQDPASWPSKLAKAILKGEGWWLTFGLKAWLNHIINCVHIELHMIIIMESWMYIFGCCLQISKNTFDSMTQLFSYILKLDRYDNLWIVLVHSSKATLADRTCDTDDFPLSSGHKWTRFRTSEWCWSWSLQGNVRVGAGAFGHQHFCPGLCCHLHAAALASL